MEVNNIEVDFGRVNFLDEEIAFLLDSLHHIVHAERLFQLVDETVVAVRRLAVSEQLQATLAVQEARARVDPELAVVLHDNIADNIVSTLLCLLAFRCRLRILQPDLEPVLAPRELSI